MFWVTQVFTWGYTLLSSLVGCLTARPAAAILSTPTVHLCVNSPNITPGSLPADFTEATFTGYAAVAISTWSAVLNLMLNVIGIAGSALFVQTGTAITQTVTGYYVTDGTGAVFYGAELFPTPVPMSSIGSFVDLTVVLPFSESQAA